MGLSHLAGPLIHAPGRLGYDSQQSQSLHLPADVTHSAEQIQQEKRTGPWLRTQKIYSPLGPHAFEAKRRTDRMQGMARPTVSPLPLITQEN